MMKQEQRDFARFPDACIERGISRPVAYRLAQAKLLETWTLGRTRYVYLDSLLSLPERADQIRQLLNKHDKTGVEA